MIVFRKSSQSNLYYINLYRRQTKHFDRAKTIQYMEKLQIVTFPYVLLKKKIVRMRALL